MANVASKQQTTALFLSSIVTRTRRHTELTNLLGNLCCAREHSVQYFVQFFYTVKLHSLWGPLRCPQRFVKYLSNLLMANLKGNLKAILKTFEVFIDGDIHYVLTHFFKIV
jgi:hypothetical protein